jgi:hypothetical protein
MQHKLHYSNHNTSNGRAGQVLRDLAVEVTLTPDGGDVHDAD